MSLNSNIAFRWLWCELAPIDISVENELDNLLCIDRQKILAVKNIQSFVNNGPFLNMLLWGEKGCGKSSLIKSIVKKFEKSGLKIIEFLDEEIISIFKLYEIIRQNYHFKFIVYFDDISFDDDDALFRRFKSVIEGSLEEPPSNVMFVATSNRRHLIAERAYESSDIYSRDDLNEKSSLFARFGLTIGFYPLKKSEYLEIVKLYFDKYGVPSDNEFEQEAENFAIERGGRSGRIAKQFAIYKMISSQEI
jgi:predicted AAA+ superfamily ATPase